jgi:hypothetical protein
MKFFQLSYHQPLTSAQIRSHSHFFPTFITAQSGSGPTLYSMEDFSLSNYQEEKKTNVYEATRLCIFNTFRLVFTLEGSVGMLVCILHVAHRFALVIRTTKLYNRCILVIESTARGKPVAAFCHKAYFRSMPGWVFF